MLKSGLNKLWPTTIKKSEFSVTEEMIAYAMQKQVHPSIEALALDMFDDYLKSELDIGLEEYKSTKVSSWVNRFEQSSMNYHTHNGAHLSSVFYLVMEGRGGEIEFYDPRHFAARGYDMNWRKLFDSITFKPIAGDVVIFPSYLYHSVSTAHGFKISVPVDLFLFNNR
jgi:uncharacterized protein (TIGR02466 family)